jgi:YidC/Oxa1 family membrane protein insertase
LSLLAKVGHVVSHFRHFHSIFVITFQSCEQIKFSHNVRNFSQLNRTTPAVLLSNRSTDFNFNPIRFKSSEAITAFDDIPEPPAIPEIATKAAELAPGVEPAFETLGLGGWTPAGIVQQLMEYLHVGVDLPWWTCIMIGTITVRTIIFPLVIKAQQNGAKMNNNLPQMQVLQTKMSEARQSGNALDAARYSQELVEFMKEKEVNPLKNMLVPLAQAPLFISFFIGLRQMANTPVESLRDGGLFWFTDLTVPDQFFLLPLITSFTMLATIEVGTDGARMAAANLQTMRYVLRALPFAILPFTINFPGAILVYWCCSNFISLGQVGFLKIPRVREYFNIDKLIHHKPEDLPMKKKGFTEGMKDSWTNMKITRELEERRRVDEIVFQKAAKGAVQKTYKFDPTKPRPATAIDAKKR